ncbi:uncharacterized protein LOC123509465 [Portunus trituberculatus]|uniref:uncharacterized protein LOC123509465 n=1 Tax=Portunus trituberculatus TaxID=210409 RepID=UPI001E1CCBA3|nr:uncharacterized protein LOC123509465 [Portunus trituberculatus]
MKIKTQVKQHQTTSGSPPIGKRGEAHVTSASTSQSLLLNGAAGGWWQLLSRSYCVDLYWSVLTSGSRSNTTTGLSYAPATPSTPAHTTLTPSPGYSTTAITVTCCPPETHHNSYRYTEYCSKVQGANKEKRHSRTG